jgi:pimeloyl-ACP methyl ester carboxylesterase
MRLAAIERNGLKLAFSDHGRGDPPMVFIHGWACDRSYFDPQVEHFKATHRVVSIDLRGHGESDKPEGAYPVSQFADDVAWLIAELRLDRPIVVGHSLGGMIAVELATRHPQSARGIVMVDPAPFALPEKFRLALENVVDSMKAGNHEPRRNFIANTMFLPTSSATLKSRIVEGMCSVPTHVAVATMRGVLDYDAVVAAKKLTTPRTAHSGQPAQKSASTDG